MTAAWISRDPLKDAERSQGPNLYEYVRNNAVNYVDPTGLFDPIGGIAGIIVGGLVGGVAVAILISPAGLAIAAGVLIG